MYVGCNTSLSKAFISWKIERLPLSIQYEITVFPLKEYKCSFLILALMGGENFKKCQYIFQIIVFYPHGIGFSPSFSSSLRCFKLRLVEIGPVVPENIFKMFKMYFHNFFIFPWIHECIRAWPFFWSSSLYQGMLFAKSSKIGQAVLEK